MSDKVNQVKKVIASHLNVELDKLTDDAKFIDDLGADSLDLVELVMQLEEDFGIDIDDEQSQQFYTVGDVVQFILTEEDTEKES